MDIFTFYTPSAFTPNNDGLNDTWSPQGTNIDTNNYEEYIYDRWGNLFFKLQNGRYKKQNPQRDRQNDGTEQLIIIAISKKSLWIFMFTK